MDTLLITLTLFSVAVATIMGVVLARTLRDERRRSDARVSVLMELAADGVAADGVAADGVHDDLALRLPASPASLDGGQELFHAHDEPSAWPRRAAVAGALAALVTVIVVGWSAIRRDGPVTAAADRVAAAAPLELLSLGDSQDAGALTISGVVLNPAAGPSQARVTVAVLVYGADGAVLTSGHAPIDFTTLAPGDESPFSVRLPLAGAAARYRVSFRGGNDEPLGHVDRRNPDALARRQAP